MIDDDDKTAVYIATCLERAEEACALAAALRAAGFIVTSRWHDTRPERRAERALSDTQAAAIAAVNYGHIDQASVLVLIADPRCKGALLETGYAIGGGIDVMVVGEPMAHGPMLRARDVMWTPDYGPGDPVGIVAALQKALVAWDAITDADIASVEAMMAAEKPGVPRGEA